MTRIRLRLFAGSLVGLALASSLIAYFLLPHHMQEASYMLSALFLFMAVFCMVAR